MGRIYNNKSIGVFDSGVGGLSVLRYAMQLLPNEKFIYFGDFKNAPYGDKSEDEIQKICIKNADMLCNMDIKALLIACNTATSACSHILRAKYSIPIVGLEPALKPAAENNTAQKSIVVMATPQTLKLNKFKNLWKSFNCNVNPVPCPGLSSLIEDAGPNSKEIRDYLKNLLINITSNNTSSIVLGCTHFSFVAKDIQEITNGINLYDGRFGTARHLEKVLDNNFSCNKQEVQLISSIDDKYHNDLLKTFMSLELVGE